MNSRNLNYYFPDDQNVAGMKVFKEAGSSITGFYFTKNNVIKVVQETYSSNYAIYFLFNTAADVPSIYIGQSTNGISRIKEHAKNKDFWNYCIMIVSDNNSFDRSAIDFLEYHFINQFKSTIYHLENIDPRITAPTIDRFLKSTYNNYASQIKFLLEANGIDFLTDRRIDIKKIEYFNAKKGCDARLYIEDGLFVLAKESVIKRPIESSANWSDGGKWNIRATKRYNYYITNNQAIELGTDSARLVVDIPFDKPSPAAELCSGYSENGWLFFDGLNDKFKDSENHSSTE